MGVKLGGSSFPMIFVLALEALTQLFLKAQDLDNVSGFKVTNSSGGIPILQFANDTLLLVGGSMMEAQKVRDLLL